MDLTGLKISIQVDLSGFTDAMVAMLAIVEVAMDQLCELEKGMKSMFDSSKTAGEGTKSAWQEFWDDLEKGVGIVKTIMDLFDIIKKFRNIFKGLGTLGATAEEGEAIAGIAALAPEVLAVAAALALVTAGVIAIVQKYKEWNQEVANINTATQQGANAGGIGSSSIDTANSKPIGDSSSSYYVDSDGNMKPGNKPGDGSAVSRKLGINMDSTTYSGANTELSTNSNPCPPCPCETNSGTDGNTTPQLTSDDQLKSALQHKMEIIREGVGNIHPKIKIKVDGSEIPEHQAQLSSLTNQYTIVQQQINNTTGALVKENEAHQKGAEWAKKHADEIKQAGSDVGSAFNAMGEAMAKGQDPGKAFLQSMLGSLSTFLAAKGAAMIGAGIGESIALDPHGPLDLAGGAALEVAAGALKAVKLATGGIVSGSSFVNVGEYAGASHNPEVIAPLDKLRNIMGGGTQNHTFEIQGDKLVSILQRVDNNNSFALGGA